MVFLEIGQGCLFLPVVLYDTITILCKIVPDFHFKKKKLSVSDVRFYSLANTQHYPLLAALHLANSINEFQN
jgi:hypothetical protein